jgi:uncharacterized membrane protein YphA (DoxX/SURF4 family)
LRRLYSTFARGAPGVGLLILRLAGIVLVVDAIKTIQGGASIATVVPHVLAAVAGILLTVGLWTPIAGTLVAVIELWYAFSQPGDPLIHILLATRGAALALLGPGAWSVDARLFGWKRIDLRDRQK